MLGAAYLDPSRPAHLAAAGGFAAVDHSSTDPGRPMASSSESKSVKKAQGSKQSPVQSCGSIIRVCKTRKKRGETCVCDDSLVSGRVGPVGRKVCGGTEMSGQDDDEMFAQRWTDNP